MRILVAEDEKDINHLIAKRLKEEGYSVDSCYDGTEVFDYLTCAEYDALILDIMMPHMDGLQVLKKTKKRKQPCSGSPPHCPRQCGRPGNRAGQRG